ncbi:T9SS type A sorting domain-containing protein [candidate division KSB1 bacterium]|nr:T9SS type A sorting domain-containing protein [candidate division KSB1 bacterium]
MLKSHSRRWSWVLFVAAVCGGISSAEATPAWTYEQIRAEQAARPAHEAIPRSPLDRRGGRLPLDDLAYFYHYDLLCQFLDGMQFTGAGNNNGGMIEGESGGDQNIIETDNTQEAIRVWSQYALWTGDTARFHENIQRAQGYCGRFPAWHEGDGGAPYYSAHNIGWGFEAVRKYRAAYGDTSWNWYADSCAAWMTGHQLNWNTELVNGYAEALGLGGMYYHAEYRGRQDWLTHCITRGRTLRSWLQTSPVRMRSESWALSGGTAMWGLSETLFRAYPDSGAIWLAEYGDELQVWESNGQWNHSFNAWYANAQHRCFELTGDSTYWNNAVYIGDSLIGLDTDADGGIYPGRTGYSPANDHSWVSAYMGWMGMERVINQQPRTDLAITGLLSPSQTLPFLAGDPLPVSLRVVNSGRQALTGTVTAVAPNFNDFATVNLATGADTVLDFAQLWIVPDDDALLPLTSIHFALTAVGDSVPANDTLTAWIDIRHGIRLSGLISDPIDPGADVTGHARVFHESYPDSVWTEFDVPANGPYATGDRRLLSGVNRMELSPPLRYRVESLQAELNPQPPDQQANYSLVRADILLVDDDDGLAYETYFNQAFSDLGYISRCWDRRGGLISSLVGLPIVAWFTGNDSLTTLQPWDESVIVEYLNSGGSVLLTGQNITDDLGPGSTFLATAMGCSTRNNDTDNRNVSGIAGSGIGDDVTLYLVGNQGANNQTSPASVYPIAGALPFLQYQGDDHQVAGVAFHPESGGSSIFLGFGFEAISGINSSTTRAELMGRMLDWFETNGVEAPVPRAIATELWLAPNYPNPFNPSTTISFVAPANGRVVTLDVFNTLGQRVAELYRGHGNGQRVTLQWNAGRAAHEVASGTYWVRLMSDRRAVSRTIQLIR